MVIPWQRLDEATLQNLIIEFVSRDGTDNGDDTPVAMKVSQVVQQLKDGTAVVVWDEITETANIIPAGNIGIA